MSAPDDIDDVERLSLDDTATRTAEWFLDEALRRQRLAASAQQPVPGHCANCGERCHACAVYCDAACRADHERVLAARSRNGAGPA